MDSILQTLKQLPKNLIDVDMVSKSIGEFLKECRSITDASLLKLAQHRIQEIDQTIASPSFERSDWRSVRPVAS